MSIQHSSKRLYLKVFYSYVYTLKLDLETPTTIPEIQVLCLSWKDSVHPPELIVCQGIDYEI